MTPAPASVAARRELEPTHACIRCGRPGVPMDKGLCEQCNPLELAQPSATQVHGIAVFGILVFVAILAVLGRAAVSGTGPFVGSVTSVEPAAGGLAITIAVANQGAKPAATTCQVIQSPAPVGGPQPVVQTPLVPAHSEVRFTTTLTAFGTEPLALTAACKTR